jgi:hypothetical protein
MNKEINELQLPVVTDAQIEQWKSTWDGVSNPPDWVHAHMLKQIQQSNTDWNEIQRKFHK